MSRYVQGHFIVEDHTNFTQLRLDTIQHPVESIFIFAYDNLIEVRSRSNTIIASYKTKWNARLATTSFDGRDLVITIPNKWVEATPILIG